MSALLSAVIEFEDQLLDLQALLEAFDGLAGDNVPPWLSVMYGRMKGLNQAFEPISTFSRDIGRATPDTGSKATSNLPISARPAAAHAAVRASVVPDQSGAQL